MVVYWGMLHEETIESPEYKGKEDRLLHNIIVHTVPGLFFLINFFMSDIIMKARHYVFFAPIGLVYGYINYIETI